MKTFTDRFNIIIADDHPSVLEGLLNILTSNPHFYVSTTASSGEELKSAVMQQPPHVVITDIRMENGDGFETAAVLKNLYPTLPVIAYSGYSREYDLLRLLNAQFNGIILKRADKEEVLEAVAMVLGGLTGFCHTASRKIQGLMQMGYYSPDKTGVKFPLNERFITILQMIAQGLSSEEMAERLNLGIQTIHTYRKRLLIKTGCSNPPALINYAYTNGYLDPEE
ncbi:MAG: response regulator transcription factor [Chitinophagaceae bacterium]|nr:MAG: response regulator transcription factor [Chitinophagaceae bacterium]